MIKAELFSGLILNISDEDWKYMCNNRFFTREPTREMIQAEFVSGTGITGKKKDLWDKASDAFAEYVMDLRQVQDLDINKMARDVLTDDEKNKVIYIVLNRMDIGDNTAAVVEGPRAFLRNGIAASDEDGMIFEIISVGMENDINEGDTLDKTSILIKGKFTSERMFVYKDNI